MPGLAFLDVAIGLIFIYLLLSLICSGILEWISGVRKWRGDNLKEGIRHLLQEPTNNSSNPITAQETGNDSTKLITADDLYKHPVIKSLFNSKKANHLPSYIPPRNFAMALMDILSPSDKAEKATTFEQIANSINKLNNPDLKKILQLSAQQAQGEIGKLRDNFEQMYSDTMDRVSGWYARKAQTVLFVIALVVSVGYNVDTLEISQALWKDQSLRESFVELAKTSTKQCVEEQNNDKADSSSFECLKLEKLKKDNTLVQLPLGWNENVFKELSFGKFFLKIPGWVITAMATSLGAPFWFNLLSKLISIRRSVLKPIEDPKNSKKRTEDTP
jgi:hypothetical protein